MNDDKPAIFRATYRNFKNVPSRGFVQLIFEVPIEQYDAAYQVLGVPHPGTESWFAIARLNDSLSRVDEAPQISGTATALPPPPPPEALPASPTAPTLEKHREKRSWFDLPAVQRAAMRCDDHRFWSWLHTLNRIPEATEDQTLAYVRRICGGSRGNLGHNGFDREVEAWDTVDRAYAKHLERQLIESMR